MSKMGLRGFASGLLISTSVFAYVYYFHSTNVPNPQLEVDQSVEPKPNHFTEELSNYLDENQLVTVDKEEYERLRDAKAELEKTLQQKNTNQQQKKIIYQTHLVISAGMSSSQVANFLEQVNIIKDSNEFQQYIEDNNLTQSIKMGEYTLDSSMSFAELAEIIT